MRKLLYDLLVLQKCFLHVTHKLYGYYRKIIYILVLTTILKGTQYYLQNLQLNPV